MEVHHHAHSENHKKKWTHYLWEFLMLFLAVFCGFLAENKREHIVEHNREKGYLKTLAGDLKTDSAAIDFCIKRNHELQAGLDSLVQFCDTANVSDKKQIETIYRIFYSWGYTPYVVTFSDRTISQLKSSGAMRLIQDRDLSESIAFYYGGVEVCNAQAETYMEDMNDLIRLSYKCFDKLYLRKGHENFSLAQTMLSNNLAYLREFINRADDLKEVIGSYNQILLQMNSMASSLSRKIIKD